MKKKYGQWNAELQAKVRDFREQKRNWTIDMAALQATDAHHKASFSASRSMRVFEISTNRHHSKLKENYSGVPIEKSLNLRRKSRKRHTRLTDSGTTNGKLNNLSRCRSFGELRFHLDVESMTYSTVGKWIHRNSKSRRNC